MAELIGTISAAVGIVGFGIQVAQTLFDYYSAYKDQDKNAKQVTERLESLLGILELLSETIDGRQSESLERNAVNSINSSILSCEEFINELQEEYNKLRKCEPKGLRGSIKTTGRRLIYPLRESTLRGLEESIEAVQENLNLALTVLQLRDSKRANRDISALKQLTELVQATQLSVQIAGWLKAPDATINHNTACAKRHAQSGLWFVEGSLFELWLKDPNSLLWANGFAGCGKSVLCSTAIQSAFVHGQEMVGLEISVAFFYFTFNDAGNQELSSMLRALVQQLSCQSSFGSHELTKMHANHPSATPSDDLLLDYLKRLAHKLDHTYIFLDGLDEVPRGRPRSQVLNCIASMRRWSFSGLHLFITSRDEVDIRDSLQVLSHQETVMRNVEIDEDINDFITSCLKSDLQLLKWKPYHDRILSALAEKAQGVFRWAECQLEAIKRCPRNVKRLEQCLRSLPEDLDQTYERMLRSVGEESSRDALRILTLLCFSIRPLTVEELTDAVAVELDELSHLDPDLRFTDADSLQEICPGLVSIQHSSADIDLDSRDDAITTEKDDNPFSPRGQRPAIKLGNATVRLAHYSVQEYLKSQRIKDQRARAFALDTAASHAEIAQICLTYLFESEITTVVEKADLEDMPLAEYAATHWHNHYSHVVDRQHPVHSYVSRLFNTEKKAFRNWTKLYDSDRPLERSGSIRVFTDTASPLYYASSLGIDWLVDELIASGAAVNTLGGRMSSALNVALREGHVGVVRRLLEAGADTGIGCPGYGTPLQVALLRDEKGVMKLLMDHGVDVDAQLPDESTPLLISATYGHVNMVRWFLDYGADANTVREGSYLRTPLGAATSGEHAEVVRLLLEKNADVNCRGSSLGTPLILACLRGNEIILRMLLDKGADVKAVIAGALFSTALEAASRQGHERIVRTLLNYGADVNCCGPDQHSFTPLRAALASGNQRVVRMLIERGAKKDLYAEDGCDKANKLEGQSTMTSIPEIQIELVEN